MSKPKSLKQARRARLILEKAPILHKFGEQLGPSSEYSTSGKIHANEIFNALRRGTSYVDRVTISGSMGKRTALSDEYEPDFDLVVFCNNKESPFNSVLHEFVNILTRMVGLRVLKQNPAFSITVLYKGFQYDICPATNLVSPHNNIMSSKSTREVQWDGFYERASSSTNPCVIAENLSTGLAESNVHFLKTQDSFTHIIVRLAKYWNEHLPELGYLSGRSFMMETVAVDAAIKYRDSAHPERVYLALRHFLRSMLKVGRKCKVTNIVFLDIYGANQVSATRQSAQSVVLDPSNPYNNLAGNLSRVQRRILGKAALGTLERLGQFLFSPRTGVLTVEDVLDSSQPQKERKPRRPRKKNVRKLL